MDQGLTGNEVWALDLIRRNIFSTCIRGNEEHQLRCYITDKEVTFTTLEWFHDPEAPYTVVTLQNIDELILKGMRFCESKGHPIYTYICGDNSVVSFELLDSEDIDTVEEVIVGFYYEGND